MNTLLRTGALLFGLLVGISAVSAAVSQLDDNFGSDEFWAEMEQGE